MIVQLTEADMQEVRAAAYWRWAEDNPQHAADRLGCELVKPAQHPSPPKSTKPRRRSWRKPGGDPSRRNQAHMRRIRHER